MQTQMDQIRAEMAKMMSIIETQQKSKECNAYSDKRHTSTQYLLTKPNERPTQANSLNYESFYFPNQPCSSSENVYHNAAHDNNCNKNYFSMSNTIAEMQNFMQEQGRINQVLFEMIDRLKTTLVTSLEKKLEATLIAVTQKINKKRSDHVLSQSNPNPRAECKAMTLKNGSNYEEFVFPTETEQEKQDQPQTEYDIAHTNLYEDPKPEPENDEETVQPEPENNLPEPEYVQPEPESNHPEPKPSGRTLPDCPERRGKKAASEIQSKYAPPAPFPQRLLQNRIDQEFRKFIDMVKELEITIPLVDAIAQIPKYAKFLKDIICNKGLLEGRFGPVKLTEQSAVLQREMPPKLDDPGRFTVPCTIRNIRIKHALCDLGANVSLMPRSIYEKIGVDELRPTHMTLQFADSSTRLPLGILEDMPIQLGKFFIPGNFVVMDMEEDDEVPIILGRPYLKTAGALIDARDGTIVFRIEDE